MPEADAHPHTRRLLRWTRIALVVGLVVTAAKFGVFLLSNSAAVLSDALESLVNVFTACMMIFSIRLANKPADRDHPYGHGKIEFVAVAIEGALILAAGVLIVAEAVRRLVVAAEPQNLNLAVWFLLAIAMANLLLGLSLHRAGRAGDSATLIADARHLFTDVATTGAVTAGLLLAHLTGALWLDPLLALGVVLFIFYTSARLLWQAGSGLMDRIDPADDAAIRKVLDEEIARGAILGYHKVRHRHQGAFHWVDMHLQLDGELSVREAHTVASRIEGRLERLLGRANATAHVEPDDAPCPVEDPTAPEPGDAPAHDGEAGLWSGGSLP